jgi:RNA polymerase sigma-70 factor (ECF subfamily)
MVLEPSSFAGGVSVLRSALLSFSAPFRPAWNFYIMSSLPPRRPLALAILPDSGQTQTVRLPQVSERPAPSDEELMVRLQADDTAALELLFHRYARLVFRIARGVVRDNGEAEDVVQEAFFHLYRKSKLFDGAKGTAKHWILQIALHRSLDRKAHLIRRGFYLGTDISSLDDTLLGNTDLEREVGSNMDRAELKKAFQELPSAQRQTLEFFYFEGLDLREISEKFHQPLGNVRHYFYRGLERLRKSSFVRQLREKKRC